MQKNNKIVVFIGLAHSGKSYESKKYIEQGYKKIAFADPLRDRAYRILGYVPENYDNFKKRPLFLDKCPDYVYNFIKKKKPTVITGRQFLQKVGDIFKINDKNFWTKRAIEEIDRNICQSSIVIEDCRFKSELVALQQYSAKNNIDLDIYFTDYRSENYTDKDRHESEALSLWLRDVFKLKHLHRISIDKGFYYKHNGMRYKTAIEINSNSFLEDKDILKGENWNDFETIVSEYRGE